MAERWSKYHITVNPNAGQGVTVQEMRAMFDHLTTAPEVFHWLRRGPHGAVPLDAGERRRVGYMRVRVGVEREGLNNRSMHAHVLLEIQHRTNVGINAGQLKQLVEQYLNVHCSLRVQFLKTDEDVERVKIYIAKEVVFVLV